MREFVESIADMRCLHTVILKNNGIDDSYSEEISKDYDYSKIYFYR